MLRGCSDRDELIDIYFSTHIKRDPEEEEDQYDDTDIYTDKDKFLKDAAYGLGVNIGTMINSEYLEKDKAYAKKVAE